MFVRSWVPRYVVENRYFGAWGFAESLALSHDTALLICPVSPNSQSSQHPGDPHRATGLSSGSRGGSGRPGALTCPRSSRGAWAPRQRGVPVSHTAWESPLQNLLTVDSKHGARPSDRGPCSRGAAWSSDPELGSDASRCRPSPAAQLGYKLLGFLAAPREAVLRPSQ